MRADLHVHTAFSRDAVTKPATFVKFAKRAGLSAVAVADHNTTAAWRPIHEAAKGGGLLIIPAEEIMCWEQGKRAGELLGLFLQEEVRPGPVADVLDQLTAQGAVIAAPHPFDTTRQGLGDRLEAVKSRLHAVEVLNAHTLSAGPNERAREFADRHGLAHTAGSDAHTPWEIGRAWVECAGSGLEELRTAILRGRTAARGQRGSRAYRPLAWLRKARLMPKI